MHMTAGTDVVNQQHCQQQQQQQPPRAVLYPLHLVRFDLAIQLGDLDVAAGIASNLDTPAKWRQLGEFNREEGGA